MLRVSDYARLFVHALDNEKASWKRVVTKYETRLNQAVVSPGAIPPAIGKKL
jgi:hypothetical protein